MGQAVPAAWEGAWDSTRGARSEREVSLPWRLPVLSRERSVTQGSVQDVSPLNPESPRQVFSQTLPFSACLRLSTCGQDGCSAGSCLYSRADAAELAFIPVTGQLQQRRRASLPRALSSCRARTAAAPLPSAPALPPSICMGTLASMAVALMDAAHLLSACVVGGCWPAPALPEGLPCPPAAAFPRPSVGPGNSVPAGSWSLRTGVRSARPLIEPAATWVGPGAAGGVPE